MVEILFKKLNPSAKLPVQATPGSAGFDLCCLEDFTLSPGRTILVDTGIAVEIPPGYEMQIRPRSGLALKFKITVLNSPGTIDSDYRASIGVILARMPSDQVPCIFNAGDRIAQAVIQSVPTVTFREVEELSDTARGIGGFGSSGVK